MYFKGFGIQTRGPGVWKFNNALLEEAEFSHDINNNLPIWIDEAKTDTNQSLGDQWGFVKFKIGEYSRKFGAKKRKRDLL